MKTLSIIIALFMATTVFAQTKTEDHITDLSAKRNQWLLHKQLDSLATLYDANSITGHGNGMIKTTAEHFEDLKADRPVYTSIVTSKPTVKLFGNTAVLVGKGKFDISMGGKPMSYNMMYTEVYQKKGTNWKLIARQAGPLEQ